MFWATSCHARDPVPLSLSDFESEADLDQVEWQCHTLFTLSAEHVTHGEHSLQLDLYPSDYPGMAFSPEDRNWNRYKTLSLDIYNPHHEVIPLAMRIDDRHTYTDYRDSCIESFDLQPGMNQLRISLASLSTSATKRRLHLQSIYRCLIFMAHPHKKHVLYIDYVRLE